ncbi:MAG: TolC family protein [Pirellulales bacterium]
MPTYFTKHRIRSAWLAMMYLLLLPAYARPQVAPSGNRTLSLADLESMAQQYHPALVAAAARVDAASGHWRQAGRWPNPVIGYHAAEIGIRDSAGQQGAFVSQKVITGGKLRLDQAAATAAVREAEFALDVQQWRVLSDVRIRFYETLVAQRRLQLTRDLSDIANQLVSSTKLLLKGRQASENDLLQAEIEAESAHMLLDNADNGHLEAWQRLMAVVGLTDLQPTLLAGDLDGDVPELDWQECYHAVMQRSPELDVAMMKVERARLIVTRQCREWIPNVDVFVSVRHHNVTTDEVANVQIGIPIPVFDANGGNVQRASSELIVAESNVRRIELDLQDRLAVIYRRYANARQQADRYARQILPRARKSLELVRRGYEQGQMDYLTLINSQRSYIRVSLAHLDAVRELRTSAVLIEGQLLSGSLK